MDSRFARFPDFIEFGIPKQTQFLDLESVLRFIWLSEFGFFDSELDNSTPRAPKSARLSKF